jgi:carbamoylphosphate synthase large subunit
MKPKINLLLSCAGGDMIPELVHNLKNSRAFDYRIIGMDLLVSAKASAFVDDFVQCPSPDDANYIEKILIICREFKIDVFLPYADEEVRLISEHKQLFADNKINLICLDQPYVDIFSNKAESYHFMEQQQIGLPSWSAVNSKEELLSALDSLPEVGVVLKPSLSRGGRDVFCIMKNSNQKLARPNKNICILSKDEFLKDFLDKVNFANPWVVMKRLIGPTYDVDILVWNNQLMRLFQRERIDTFNPYKGYQFKNDNLITHKVEKLIEGTNVNGLFECDIMLDENGEPHIIEINCRPSGGIAITASAGDNLIDDMVSTFVGQGLDKKLNTLQGNFITYHKLSAVEAFIDA